MRKYTKELLEWAVKDSANMGDVCRKLGTSTHGGMRVFLKSKIHLYGIDISHFLGQRSGSKGYNGEIRYKKKPATELLVIQNNPKYKQHGRLLKRALIEVGVKEICYICGLGTVWAGKALSLQVHHVNGDATNNTKENLVFICPNCHSQTEDYCGKRVKVVKKVKKPKNIRVKRYRGSCLVCGKEKKRSSYKFCSLKCSAVGQRMVPRPSYEQLKKDLEYLPMVKVGNKYNVSNNTIKKWLKNGETRCA